MSAFRLERQRHGASGRSSRSASSRMSQPSCSQTSSQTDSASYPWVLGSWSRRVHMRLALRSWPATSCTVLGVAPGHSPALALASTVAFVCAELVDLLVYEPVRKSKGFLKGALASNIVSAPIDTFAFLSLAGFPLTMETVTGQFVGKVLWATALPLCVYWGVRRLWVGRTRADAMAG